MGKSTTPTRPGPLPTILDRELSNRSGDAFGHQHYADALKDLIESKEHSPPYSIGLLGSWGTGKSSIKQLYLSDLSSDAAGKVGERRSDRFFPITFNAWRYGGTDDLKRALLRHVFRELNGDEAQLRRDLFQQVSSTVQKRRTVREYFEEAFLQNVGSIVTFIALLALVLGAFYLAAKLIGLSDQIGLTAVLVSASPVAIFLAKYVVDLRLRSPTFFNPNTVISFPQTSAEEYENLLVEQIHKFGETTRGKRCRRLVIFVDDLDRLSAAEMVNGLDAVRTFLELPLKTNRDDFGVVFVISCDEDRVSDALFKGRGRVGGAELPGTVFSRSDARRYLDRLFQFRLEIPPFPRLDMRAFALSRLKEAGTVASELEEKGVEPADVVERLIHVDVRGPRNAIQLLNAFIQSWWIGRRREFEGLGSNVPGALSKGSVTEHPKSLAALCVLRVDFPDFYEALQKRPELIHEFSRLLFGQQDPTSLPVAAADLIRDFVVVSGDALTSEIRPEHRGLRRYLASLQGLRWPRSLQPLLLLSEDPVTRRYGPKAVDLYEAFISGDTSGVMEALGHQRDTLPLNREDLVLLNDVAQGIGTETVGRRIGAARVLASIVGRIPEANRRQLLTPLGRQMVEIKDVRTNVGPRAASTIIAELASEDQVTVADAFVADFLAGKIDWQLPTGEQPDLDQLTELTEQAVDLALTVRSTTELSSKADAILRKWLLSREVASTHSQTTLQFDRLEAWLEAFPGQLLYDLGAEYSQQAVTQLVNSPGDPSKVDATIGRIKSGLTRLSGGGVESRTELWAQLSEMVAAKRQAVAEAAYELAAQLKDTASRAGSTAFLVALSERLFNQAEDEDEWPLDWEAGANVYLDLLSAWGEAIDEKVGEAAIPILHNWAEYSESAAFANRASQLLSTHAASEWATYQLGLFEQSLGFFASEVYAFEAGIFEDLPDAVRQQATATLTQAIAAEAIKDNVRDAYAAFLSNLRNEAWVLPELQQHLSAAMERLIAKIDDPAFIEAVLPTVRQTLEFAEEGVTGSFLSRLFAPSSNSAKAFAAAHGIMVKHWPPETPPVGAYSATKIASRALDVIVQTPSAAGMDSVFASAVDLVARGIASSLSPKLAQAAVALWPNYPDAVAVLSSDIAPHLSDADVVSILSISADSGEQTASKQRLASAVAVDANRSATIAAGLLAVPPLEIDAQPDGALGMWLDVLGDKRQDTLRQLLGEELNDEQGARLSSYMFGAAEKVGLDFLLECLPTLLRPDAFAETVEWLTSHFQMLSSLTPTRTEKSALASVLIDCLPRLSGEPLARTAALIGSLGGKGALEKRSNVLASLDAGQIRVVAAQIPSSTLLAERTKGEE